MPLTSLAIRRKNPTLEHSNKRASISRVESAKTSEDDGMDLFNILFGPGEGNSLTSLQMGARAIAVYLVTLTIIRVGKKRFMGRATAFDVIVGIVLGSIVSRAITGNAPMVPTMSAAAVIMALHWAFSFLPTRWAIFGKALKGRDRLLVSDGTVDEDALRATHMTSRDLFEAIRQKGIAELAAVSEARLERDGSVSVIKKTPEPRIVNIQIEPGVQTVRLEIA